MGTSWRALFTALEPDMVYATVPGSYSYSADEGTRVLRAGKVGTLEIARIVSENAAKGLGSQ